MCCEGCSRTSCPHSEVRMRSPLALALALVAAQAAGPEGPAVTIESLLREMVDADSVARWPAPEFTSRQASSHDRATVASDKPGWFANNDHTQYLRVEARDGRRENVMVDADGPGAI